MPRAKANKYNRKYCKQLKAGLRSDGSSIAEVCQKWDITRATYYDWIEKYPEFKQAHDYGNRDCAAWWHQLNRSAACGQVKANAGIICFAMKNIEGIGWQDKVEVSNIGEEQIRQINISILPPSQQALPHNLNIIEHQLDEIEDDVTNP